jgi:succinoglycan biosynthesis transport protein ExoP
MELSQYFNVIKRWWWLLIVGMIIPMSISYHFLSKQPALYQASVTLMVGTTLQQTSPDPNLMQTSTRLGQAYTELVKRRPITQAVIQKLNLEKSPDDLAKQITAWISPEAQLLEIMVTDTNPQAAALIANALADELIRQSPASVEDSQRQQAFIRGQLADLEVKITDVQDEIRELEDSLANLTSAAEIDEAQQKLLSLQAVESNYRSTYASLLQSLIQSSTNILNVVEQAIVPPLPASSRSELILLVAGAAGLALSLGAAFVIEFLDDTLRWKLHKDRALLDLPVVGLMPRLPQEYGHISTDIPLDSSEAEALRLLRSNIFLTLARRSISTLPDIRSGRQEDRTTIIVTSPVSTFLVTSPGRREGRTSIVASLGMAIAFGGQRVIIVDADLRTPGLHEVFGLPNDYGLCELLLGHSPSLQAALQETSIPNLNLLPAGKIPLDLALALTSPRLIELIEALMEQADIIIFDSPPVLLAPDTAILSGLVEGTLLVVRDGYTTLESASRSKERLLAYQGAPIMGILFSRARLGGRTLLPRRRPRSKPLIAPPPVSEQRFGGEVAEEWYPPLDQGVEVEPAEGLAVKSQATEGEDRSE